MHDLKVRSVLNHESLLTAKYEARVGEAKSESKWHAGKGFKQVNKAKKQGQGNRREVQRSREKVR